MHEHYHHYYSNYIHHLLGDDDASVYTISFTWCSSIVSCRAVMGRAMEMKWKKGPLACPTPPRRRGRERSGSEGVQAGWDVSAPAGVGQPILIGRCPLVPGIRVRARGKRGRESPHLLAFRQKKILALHFDIAPPFHVLVC